MSVTHSSFRRKVLSSGLAFAAGGTLLFMAGGFSAERRNPPTLPEILLAFVLSFAIGCLFAGLERLSRRGTWGYVARWTISCTAMFSASTILGSIILGYNLYFEEVLLVLLLGAGAGLGLALLFYPFFSDK